MTEWRREDVFKLISLYKEMRLFWDPFDVDYKNRSRKHDSWRELDEQLGVEYGESEKKMRKLVGQFQREYKKLTANGKFTDDEGRWVYFKSLLFLGNKNRTLSNSENLEAFENVEDQDMDLTPPPSKVLKLSQMSPEVQLIEPAEKFSSLSETKLYDSWEAFGLSVGGDLRNLESKQQTIAQKLISDVIFLAKLGRLSEGSVVAEPPAHLISSNLCPTPPLSHTSSDTPSLP